VLVSFHRPYAFSPEEVRVIFAFASHAAIVIQVGRLIKETSQITALKETDKLKSEFLSNVSHELRTPLTSIRISVESLLAAAGAQPSGLDKRLLENVRRNADRLGGLVNELLDMSRIQSGRLTLDREPLDLSEVIAEATETIRPMAERAGIQLDLHMPSEAILVTGDRARLTQVLLNLLTNATEFVPPQGKVTVQAGATNGMARVSVADNGPGIPPAERPYIFDRFYRGRLAEQGRHAGLGLGLPIAKALVELHNGSMWVESGMNRGATFVFTLPLVPREEAHEDSAGG
jgi:signal transduction histidine kinase